MVELKNVSKDFGAFRAVDRVNLTIQTGEFLTLLGPSGCGKTTLLRMIRGFETPTEGSIWLCGEDVTHRPPYRRNVNQVFQSYALFPHLSVEENIAFGLKMQKLPKPQIVERVKEITALVFLEGMEQRRPHELSGGQKQRVALARALICRPKVLLLDEPLSALDAKLRHQMQVELKGLQKKLGITFVLVTHDQEEALTMSDRIAVVNRGRIEQVGSCADIYHAPQTSFVASFIGKANILEARRVSEEGRFVRLGLGSNLELFVPAESAFRDTMDLFISIRPEKIHLQKGPRPAGENVFQARVEEALFKGASSQLELRTTGGLHLLAVVSNESSSQQTFAPGNEVWCTLHPSDIVIVRGA